MTSTIKALYAGSAALTWTSAGTLANGSAAGCLAIDNGTNLYTDAMVSIYPVMGAGSIASDKVLNIYGSYSEDGTTYLGSSGASLDNYTGTDAAQTLQAPTVFSGPFVHPAPNAGLTFRIVIPSLCALFGLIILPRKWGLIIENRSGLAFSSITASYSGVQPQIV